MKKRKAVLLVLAAAAAVCVLLFILYHPTPVNLSLHGVRWNENDYADTRETTLTIKGEIRHSLFHEDAFFGTIRLGEIEQTYDDKITLPIQTVGNAYKNPGLLLASGFYYDPAENKMHPIGAAYSDPEITRILIVGPEQGIYSAFPAENQTQAVEVAREIGGRIGLAFEDAPEPDEMPLLPESLALDPGVEIDTMPKKACDLLGERVYFDWRTLADGLFRNPDHDPGDQYPNNYTAEPVGDLRDHLTVGDDKVSLFGVYPSQAGWFRYVLLRLYTEPYEYEDASIRSPFLQYSPRAYDREQVYLDTAENRAPGKIRYASRYTQLSLPFASLDEAQAQAEQTLSRLGLDELGIGIRYGYAMDAETLLLLSDCDPALVEDGAFYFRLTQSFGGIPLLDGTWLSIETEEMKALKDELKPGLLSSVSEYNFQAHSGTSGEVYINRNGLAMMVLSGVCSLHADGEAQTLLSCAKALESVIAYYADNPQRQTAHIADAHLAYVTLDAAQKGAVYHYIPAYVFDVWEYETREVDGETLQYATLNRFVIDAKTGARLSENGETE